MSTLCKSLLAITVVVASGLLVQAGGPAPAAQAGQTLTDDGLQTLLANLGYQPAARKYEDGVPYCEIKVKHDNRTWTVTVEVTPNKRMVGFGIFLNKNVPAMDRARLLRLLQENDVLKSRFLIAKNGSGLYLTGYLDNRGVTPELLQTELGAFLQEVVQTEAVWRDAKAAGRP
jgi:hypothetical protein